MNKLENYSSPFFSHNFQNEKWHLIADWEDSFVYKNQDYSWVWNADKVLKIYLKSNLSEKDLQKYYFACQKFDEFLVKKLQDSNIKIRTLYTKNFWTNEFDFGQFSYSILPMIKWKNFLDISEQDIVLDWKTKPQIKEIIFSLANKFFWLKNFQLNDMNIQFVWDKIILTDIGDSIKSFLTKIS